MPSNCIDCSDLAEAVETVCSDPTSQLCLNDIAVAWIVAVEGPLGRLSIARRLGLSERRVRASVDRLRRGGIVEVDPVAGVYGSERMPAALRSVKCKRTSKFLVSAVIDPCADLLEAIENHVVDIRDDFMLTVGSKAVELIGYTSGGRLHAPHVPEELLKGYDLEVRSTAPEDSIVFLLKRDSPLYYCPAVLLPLYRQCKRG